jgi:KaiC/GvpD/RAD55 family RecA-like ATPase
MTSKETKYTELYQEVGYEGELGLLTESFARLWNTSPAGIILEKYAVSRVTKEGKVTSYTDDEIDSYILDSLDFFEINGYQE